MERNNFIFSRKIKLPPAIGDWTTIQYRNTDLEEISISQVHNINFDSLTREQLQYVHYLHYRLAERVARKLSHDMDVKVELHTVVATQVAYEDFIGAQKDEVVQSDIVIDGIGRMSLMFEWALADTMVNRLTGGKAEPSAVTPESFSEIELEVLRTQVEQVLPFLLKAWKLSPEGHKVKLGFGSGHYTPDSRIAMREAYIIFTLYFYFGRGDLRKMTWTYPNSVLRRLLYWRGIQPDPVKQRIMLYRKTMSAIRVPVKVNLGKATLTMKELKSLQPGDILTLDSRLDAALELTIGKKAKLWVQPGVMQNKLAVQVLSRPLEHEHTVRSEIFPTTAPAMPEEPPENTGLTPVIEVTSLKKHKMNVMDEEPENEEIVLEPEPEIQAEPVQEVPVPEPIEAVEEEAVPKTEAENEFSWDELEEHP